MAKSLTIGIVGFGDFGRLMVQYLSEHARLLVTTRREISRPKNFDCEFVDPDTVLAQDIIILSLPAQHLESYLKENLKRINPGALIVDVCSVKVEPVEVMRRVLPETNQILATHPLFGPASAADSIQGQRIMLYPVRLDERKYAAIKDFLRKLGLRVIESTPEEHDRAMAYVQGLSHYIGRVMQLMDIPETELITAAYSDLLDMKRIQGGDSWDLFYSIMHENPYALAINKRFKKASADLDKKLDLDRR
jgi:prephenate dehydrogenase